MTKGLFFEASGFVDPISLPGGAKTKFQVFSTKGVN
jgi:hypothetical protein